MYVHKYCQKNVPYFLNYMIISRQRSIFGDSKRGANKEEIPQMFYLERVIKESMRLYTVVPIIARNVDKDTYLRKYCFHAFRKRYVIYLIVTDC